MVVMLAGLAVGVAAVQPAHAASLVLDLSHASGWRSVAAKPQAVRGQLGHGLPRRARIEVAKARSAGVQLLSGAALLRSPRMAHRLVVAWGRAQHARPLGVGDEGRFVSVRHGRRALVRVVWREGDRVGVLVLHLHARHMDVREAALEWARPADTALKTPLPADSWSNVMAGIRPNGSFSRQTALQAFASEYGNAPGITAPPARRNPEAVDATAAATMVLRYRSTLTARERAVVDRRLGLEPVTRSRAHAAAGPVGDLGDPSFRFDGVYTAQAMSWAQTIGAELRPLTSLTLIEVGRSNTLPLASNGQPALMDALPINPNDPGLDWTGGPGICRIRIGPTGVALDDTETRQVLAHEVFHCFEFDILQANWKKMPLWVQEGMANWAAFTVDPVSTNFSVGWVKKYIENPQISLSQRSYDAVGFFGHAQDTLGSFWPRVIPTLQGSVSSFGAAYAAAGGNEPDFLTGWGSSLFRDFDLGLPWQMISPIKPASYASLRPGHLGLVPGKVVANPEATAQFLVDDTAEPPLFHFEIPGDARMTTAEHEYTDLHDAWFCAARNPQDCQCPPGSEGTTPASQPIENGDQIGVSGGAGGDTGTVSAHSLDEFCKQSKPKPSPGQGGGTGASGGIGCSSNCGSSNGDPHLVTFDGYSYDFQAAGEFTAVKSTTDDLEIQTRQQPFKSPDVTVNTAIAMRVAGTRVEIEAGTPSLTVRINGAAATITSSPTQLPNGGTVALDSNEIVVTWPDGSQAQAWGVGPWGVAWLFEPVPTRAGHLQGLLGSFDGDPQHLAGRDGRVYPVASLEGKAGFRLKYHEFGESWRITQADSLFTYAPGKSTATYTDRGIPHGILTIGSLSAKVRTSAERTCREQGVTQPTILRDCELDVGVTKEPAFATSQGTLQHTASTPRTLTPPPPPPPPGPTSFKTTCDTSVQPDANGQIPVGTDVGIEVQLQPDIPTAEIVIHWPQDQFDDPGGASTSDFHELDTPGIHTAYASYAGDANHPPATSATCTWNVAG